MDRETFAEKCATFIFTKLEKVGENTKFVKFDRKGKADPTVPNDKRGIYLFFADLNGRRYPVYLGKTDTSFRTRFSQHDVINQYMHGDIDKLFHDVNKDGEVCLGAMLIYLPLPMVIKLAESLFLCAFNFALNGMENVAPRTRITDLDQTPDNIISKYFSPALDAMEKESKDIVKRLRS